MEKENKPLSGLALAGFICSFLFASAGLIISIIALATIDDEKERGKGFAIAGLLISLLNILISISIIFFLLTYY